MSSFTKNNLTYCYRRLYRQKTGLLNGNTLSNALRAWRIDIMLHGLFVYT